MNDEGVGTQANELFKDAQELLNRIFDEKLLTAKAIFGLFPANTINDDDIELELSSVGLSEDEDRLKFLTLRQQSKKRRQTEHCISRFYSAKRIW